MNAPKILSSVFRDGIWTAVIEPGAMQAKRFRVDLEGVEIASVDGSVSSEGTLRVEVPIQSEVLSDGINCFLLCDPQTDNVVASIPILIGSVLDQNDRAELALVRQELDLLKAAFRRHCRETS